MEISTSVLEAGPFRVAAASRPKHFFLRGEWGMLIPIAAVCAILGMLEAVIMVVCNLDPLLIFAG